MKDLNKHIKQHKIYHCNIFKNAYHTSTGLSTGTSTSSAQVFQNTLTNLKIKRIKFDINIDFPCFIRSSLTS
jgi:hypothetical protein